MGLLDGIVFEDNCLVCGKPCITHDIQICEICYKKLRIKKLKFEFKKKNQKQEKYFPDSILYVSQYNEVSSMLIKSFKYRGVVKSGIFIASLMAESLPEILDYYTLTYIPYDYFKKFNRVYNHSALLCSYISSLTGIGIEKDILRKKLSLLSQAKLPFFVRRNRPLMFKPGNKPKSDTILIIDDVVTTGRTFIDASYVIKKQNPEIKVHCLAFAGR